MIDKDLNRYKHSTWILMLVMFLSVSLVGLAFADKLTSEFSLGLGVILGYAGNHTYQNYSTNPEVK